MTTIADFYTQNDEAFALISKIRLPEDFNPKKEYYFDDLVMSNILSFIPKYPKKAKRYNYFRCGVFEELNSLEEYEGDKSWNIIIIEKITPKMIVFSEINRYRINNGLPKRKRQYSRNNIEYFRWGVKLNSAPNEIYANKLIPIREMTMNQIMDRTWFAPSNRDIDEIIHYIRNPHQS